MQPSNDRKRTEMLDYLGNLAMPVEAKASDRPVIQDNMLATWQVFVFLGAMALAYAGCGFIVHYFERKNMVAGVISLAVTASLTALALVTVRRHPGQEPER